METRTQTRIRNVAAPLRVARVRVAPVLVARFCIARLGIARLWVAPLVVIVALSLSGCHRDIVRASTPAIPPARRIAPLPKPLPLERPAPDTVPPPEPASEPVLTAGMALPAPLPPRPVVAEAPRAKPESEPPQISPELSPRDQADAMLHTNDDIRTAERNLQAANGKKLNASQTDLVGKVQGFLSQARDAIRANDWVRARNLALKAQVLSTELIKSL